jgi:Uma2 family endonuclease
VVEVADASLRLDRRVKGSLYARGGLPEYWIVDLVDAVVEVHRDPQPTVDTTHGWAYRSVAVPRPPAVLSPLGAPGARLAVADLLP